MVSDNKMKNIEQFFKLLIEWGGIYKVDDELFIKTVGDDQPVLININNIPLPMMLFNENMKTGKHTFFNPLIEPLGHSAERSWFKQSRSLIAGNLVKQMMIKIVELSIAEDGEVDYDKLEIIRPFIKQVDKKLISEIEKLEPVNILRIYYNKGKRIAQIQTDLLEPEYQESIKIRKGSWEPIVGMLVSFLGTDDIHEEFQHKATIISMQETDAYLHVMLKLTCAIHQYVALLLDVDLKAAEFELYMEHLDEYRKACAWAVTGTIQQDRAAVKPDEVKSLPWKPMIPSAPVVQPMFLPQQFPDMGMGGMQAPQSLPKNDPGMLARLAKQIEHNPYMDVNQIVSNDRNMRPQFQPVYAEFPQMNQGFGQNQTFALRGPGFTLPTTDTDSGCIILPKPRNM